ncbi:MAG: serine/threonine-protein kinase [Acidobacteriota bacterium]
MNDTTTELEARFAQFVEYHVLQGERLPVRDLCADRPDLEAPLRALIDRYLSLATTLGGDPLVAEDEEPVAALPHFEGFQTIERIGAGGMGEVFKLRDLRLGRTVAAKVVRRGTQGWKAATDRFLREARALALFSDRRIVQVFDFRPDSDPPVIIMELVDGFELGQIGGSLEFAQRARIMIEICEAVHHAHTLGLQHRDLKPSNIMLDAQLAPRILDFGLSAAEPTEGHLQGTLPYVAPEQLDPAQPIDARTDVYALGVICYELLCGRPPYAGTDPRIVQEIRGGRPSLPVEIDARVPEPLQAVALTAMEAAPAARYQTALEMAADLRRFLDGRAVLARPSLYASTLGMRVKPHLDHLGEWLRLRLIYPHEAERLRAAYRALDAREDDWIVESRTLSYTQIALYAGAFLLICGSLFYFAADRWYETVHGVALPFAVLALPFVGLNAAAHRLYARDHRAVAVAFYLAAVALLPLFLLILFHDTGLLVVPSGTAGQLFEGGAASNHQLQVTTAVACAWCGWLALRTRTAALSSVFAILTFLLTLSLLADAGLREWIETDRWDLFALHVFPLVGVYAALGAAAERTGRPWFSRPVYLASALLLVLVLELLALDGRAFHDLGISLRPFQRADLANPLLLDTLAAMTLNGVVFYGAAAWLNRRGSEPVRTAAQLLFSLAPFALLQPLGYLVRTAQYSFRFDWIYAAFAAAIMVLSQRRQRRSFYYAGLLNLGAALFLVADHRAWFSRPAWGIAIIAAGLAALGTGFALDRAERRGRV